MMRDERVQLSSARSDYVVPFWLAPASLFPSPSSSSSSLSCFHVFRKFPIVPLLRPLVLSRAREVSFLGLEQIRHSK